MSQLNQIKATQKRSQYARHGYEEILPFELWLNTRLAGMQKDGATVKACKVNEVLYIQITWKGQQPKVFTDSDFREEYADTYLAAHGLNCKLPFEENVGVTV
jgi:hypothetical protein